MLFILPWTCELCHIGAQCGAKLLKPIERQKDPQRQISTLAVFYPVYVKCMCFCLLGTAGAVLSVRYWFCVFTLAHLLKPPVFVHRAQHKMEEAFKAIVDLAARQQVQIQGHQSLIQGQQTLTPLLHTY